MRKYLSKLIHFGLILFPVLVAVDYAFSSAVRKTNYERLESWEEILGGHAQSDIAFMGSSRTHLHIDPAIIDSVICADSYNLGMDASPFNRQVQRYNIFRQRNPKPKVIIQNIDAWTLAYGIGHHAYQFYPFFWDTDMRKTFFPTEPFTFGEKYIPFYRYHGWNLQQSIHRMPRSSYKGYSSLNLKWDGKDYSKLRSFDFIVNDTTLRLFNSFLQDTRDDSIKVIFVYAPLYHGATKKLTNIDEMHQTYQSLADEYGIPILDYTDMWICHDTTYFYNAMHLNKTGAEIFTDSLANDIKRLGVL